MVGSSANPAGDRDIDERWERLVSAVVHVQSLIPEATLIGGSAITMHTGHRLSEDADLVLRDLDRRWHHVRAELEELSRWITDYPRIPTNLMGRFDGARVSIRKLNRTRGIEIAAVEYAGHTLRVAAPDELVRMKGLALVNRKLTRDYVDIAALDRGLREAGRSAAEAITDFDAYYADPYSSGSRTREILAALSAPNPREDDPQAVLDSLTALRPDLAEWS